MTAFEQDLKSRIEITEAILQKYLPEETGAQKTVLEAMNYSVLAGGKRLRPILMMESYKFFGGRDLAVVEPFMAAIEMIHTYSLVHDDLPAMDNDEYRRGRKTTHVVYGAGMATLAGDGLLNYAFETALKAASNCENPRLVLQALSVLAEKAGVYGMVGGQCADIEAEERDNVTEEDLMFIHEHKTAAMIESCLMIGATLAAASEDEIRNMEKVGSLVGIAFQIQDDILDVTGDEATLGKPIGSDEKNGKTTYVTLHGIEASAQKVQEMSEEAEELLSRMQEDPENGRFLQDMIQWLIHRTL